MAERPTLRLQRNQIRVPETQSFEGMAAWAETALKVSSVIGKYTDRAIMEESKKQGSIDGAKVNEDGTPDIKLRSNISMFGQAYNQAALQGYASSLDISISKKAEELAAENSGDSNKFATEFGAYSKGLLKGIQKQAPELAAAMQLKGQTVGTHYFNQIAKHEAKRQIEAATADNQQSFEDNNNLLSNILASEPDADTAVKSAIHIAAIQNERINAGGYPTKDNPNGTGMLNPKQQADMRDEVQFNLYRGIALRGLKEAEKTDSSLEYIQEFGSKRQSDISQEEHDKVMSQLHAELAKDNKLSAGKHAAEEDSTKEVQADNFNKDWVKASLHGLTEAEVIAGVSEYKYTPEQGKKLQAIIKGNAVDNDVNVLAGVTQFGLPDTAVEILELDASPEMKAKLINRWESEHSESGHFAKSEDWKRVKEDILGAHALTAFGSPQDSAESRQKATVEISEIYDKVSELPKEVQGKAVMLYGKQNLRGLQIKTTQKRIASRIKQLERDYNTTSQDVIQAQYDNKTGRFAGLGDSEAAAEYGIAMRKVADMRDNERMLEKRQAELNSIEKEIDNAGL